jgi:hypothetical protein
MMPQDIKKRQIRRIMMESAAKFSHQLTAQQYIDIYEKMLHRPLVYRQDIDASAGNTISARKNYHQPDKKDPKAGTLPLERSDEKNIIRFPERKRGGEKHRPKLHQANK